VNQARDYTLIVVPVEEFYSISLLRVPSKKDLGTRNHHGMGVVEQDNEKEKEQIDSLEGQRTQGTREL
jgi:hypothetical protein